jgi:hypothetical protein
VLGEVPEQEDQPDGEGVADCGQGPGSTGASAGVSAVKDMANGIHKRMLAGYATPHEAAEDLVQATALMANVQKEVREADHAYAVVLLRFLDADEAAARARIRAETSLEYLRKREARDMGTFLEETVRTLKTLVKLEESQMRMGG